MKYSHLPFFCLILLLGLSGLQGCKFRADSTDVLARKVFEAFQEDNFEILEPILPDKRVLELMYYQLQATQEAEVTLQHNDMEQLSQIVLQGLKRGFQQLQRESITKGLNTTQCRYLESKARATNSQGIETTEVTVFFQYGNEQLSLLFTAVKVYDGWYLWEGLRPGYWYSVS
ncbi:hypothetical protein [Eisenibacter elegans]|jgi:hypothetical protein|uniref:hypothetical protein n=1 Tax=Eisenibacter elegans TaxID=997 RepID=UPI00042811E6|nr:hypothetical protein [Eisenibacter elegans]